ncbi:ABC transporter substrate-binding protein [Camelliibacillus cellulosilyticus]|uniref:ABC transporter substrate-binding protein n=1 Tax=Camelliibacillus cellulosilyticus TaxID=2174486 RepID=A0ABV9GPX8_9BACL
MKKILLSVALILCLVLTACSNNQSGGKATSDKKGGGQLLVAADQDPVGLDPQKVPAASSSRIYSLVYSSLTKMDADFKIVPDLAKSWDISKDGKTVTFHLRNNVKFHNGRAMTSDDVKYSYERILDPKTGSIAKSYFTSINAIETPDKDTVVFKLKTPDSSFLANTSSSYAAIVPKEVKDLNTEAVGTGPYKLDTIMSGQYVLLKKNKDYYDNNLPKADAIKFVIMKDEAQRTAAIRSGKVDIAAISADTAKLLEKSNKVDIKKYQSLEYSYLGFNTNKKPFNDSKVRQAISYAVDRKDIVDTVWKGQAALTGPIAPAQKEWALDTNEYPSYKQDIKKAKELLKEAGYPDGFDTVIQTASTYPDMVETAQVLQQQLKAIGIKAQIQQLEWGNYIKMWQSKSMDMMVGRNTSGMDPDRSLRFFFSTTGSANVWNYSSPVFDKLVQNALATTDQQKRKDFYDQAQKLLEQEAPNLFLASPENFYAVSHRVKGFVPTSAGESTALIQASVK